MPDGSNTDPRQNLRPRASGSGTVSHPLMGSTRSEPAMRNTVEHGTPPININLTVPILGRRFYFAIAGGKERRSKERLALERQRSPLLTKSNIQFIVIGAVVLYMLTLGTFLVFAAVLEP